MSNLTHFICWLHDWWLVRWWPRNSSFQLVNASSWEYWHCSWRKLKSTESILLTSSKLPRNKVLKQHWQRLTREQKKPNDVSTTVLVRTAFTVTVNDFLCRQFFVYLFPKSVLIFPFFCFLSSSFYPEMDTGHFCRPASEPTRQRLTSDPTRQYNTMENLHSNVTMMLSL